MKRRKGVTVFSTLACAFTILAIASYVVILLAFVPMFKDKSGAEPFINAFDILARNKDIINAFTTFDKTNLVPNILVFGYIGVFALVTIIWLIVDLKRGRKIVFFFALIFLCAMYSDLLYNLTVLPIEKFIIDNVEDVPYLLVPVCGAGLGALASLLSVVLFIVDVATGSVEKNEPAPFIQEPTEEIKEGVFEEVKDENEEAAKEEEVAPAPAPVEEEVEEAPEEEEAPVEEAKPAPAKKAAPAKKEEPKKEDARKTQTILLTNEEGNVYAKAYHVSRRPELNKWQVKATGSDKALKLFNTQKEAIEYANELAKNQNVSVRVHSKEGKIRKHNG